jgi:hypothetical protein
VRGTAAQALLDRGWGKPKVVVINYGGGGYLVAFREAQVSQPRRRSILVGGAVD